MCLRAGEDTAPPGHPLREEGGQRGSPAMRAQASRGEAGGIVVQAGVATGSHRQQCQVPEGQEGSGCGWAKRAYQRFRFDHSGNKSVILAIALPHRQRRWKAHQ
eukprot:2034572-Pyramimonas_sp.AAC.1